MPKPNPKWTKENRKKPRFSRCDAKLRSRPGDTCQNYAMPNGRCRMHGGKTKMEIQPGEKLARKIGLYEVGLHDEEKEIYHDVEVGNIDEEIRMAKLKLRRAYKAQKWWEEQTALKEAGVKVKRKIRLVDYSDEIGRFTKLVGVLESKRAMIREDSTKKEMVAKLIQDFRQFADEAISSLPGGSM